MPEEKYPPLNNSLQVMGSASKTRMMFTKPTYLQEIWLKLVQLSNWGGVRCVDFIPNHRNWEDKVSTFWAGANHVCPNRLAIVSPGKPTCCHHISFPTYTWQPNMCVCVTGLFTHSTTVVLSLASLRNHFHSEIIIDGVLNASKKKNKTNYPKMI